MGAQQPQPAEVVIEFFGPRPVALDELSAAHPQEITVIESKGFAATEYTLQVLLAASAGGAIQGVVAIIRAHIEAKQHVSIKADGVEIVGVSAKDAERILEHLHANGELPEEIRDT